MGAELPRQHRVWLVVAGAHEALALRRLRNRYGAIWIGVGFETRQVPHGFAELVDLVRKRANGLAQRAYVPRVVFNRSNQFSQVNQFVVRHDGGPYYNS